ncbi:FixH family protein [Paenibacillus hodogayensis]|uniref:FixH family protein n=1 Tax=Paenibacillus hodogayensis TaxID=279208 RepID=A0ABV5W3G5_9BACL
MQRGAAALVLLAAVGIAALGGCASAPSGAVDGDGVAEIIQVMIRTVPETLTSGKPVKVEARITQAGEAVDDAKKVDFELWKRGETKHRTIAGKHQGDGVYAVETTFPSDGIYYVVAHANGWNMHSMPRRQLVVGQVSAEDIAKAEADPDKSTYH